MFFFALVFFALAQYTLRLLTFALSLPCPRTLLLPMTEVDLLVRLPAQAVKEVLLPILSPLSTNLSPTWPTRNDICLAPLFTSNPHGPLLCSTPSSILNQSAPTHDNNSSSPICPPLHQPPFIDHSRRTRSRFSTTPSTHSSPACPNFLKPPRSLRTHMCLICISYMLLKTLKDHLRSLQH